jgi:hypothetical protein
MNRDAFRALTPGQREILRRAGREAVEPGLRRIVRDEAAALRRICSHTEVDFAAASSSELAALTRAVRPVYRRLERDPLTMQLLSEIRAMRGPEHPTADALSTCGKARAEPQYGAASALEGRWQTTRATPDELLAAGIEPRQAGVLGAWPGPRTAQLVFANGRQQTINPATGAVYATGTYEVTGEVVTLIFQHGVGVLPGRPYELRWSVYRDVLQFRPAPGSEPLRALVIRPFTRVR